VAPMADDPQPGAPGAPETPTTEPLAAEAARSGSSVPAWVPRLVILYFVGLAAFSVVQWLLGRLSTLLLDLVVALFLSFALEPAVNWLDERGWRRGVATATAFLGLLVFGVVFLFAIGAVVVDQVSGFIDQAPTYAEDLALWVNDRFGTNISVDALQAELTREDGPVRGLAGQLANNAVAIGAEAFGAIIRLLAIGLFTFYLVADGPRVRRVVCSVLPPARQHRVLETWEIAIDKTGGYLYSRALLAAVSTVAHWIAFELVGLPYAAALALFVGLISQFVPTIGTYLAGAVPVLVALANDPVQAIWVLVIIVIYQQVENYLLAPRVTARTMELHPAVAFGTVLAGAALFGGVGALLALPAAAVLQALISTYVSRHDVVETRMTRVRSPGGPRWTGRLAGRFRRSS
jgi:predicted PurR-regulated permease PerM